MKKHYKKKLKQKMKNFISIPTLDLKTICTQPDDKFLEQNRPKPHDWRYAIDILCSSETRLQNLGTIFEQNWKGF